MPYYRPALGGPSLSSGATGVHDGQPNELGQCLVETPASFSMQPLLLTPAQYGNTWGEMWDISALPIGL